MASATVEAAAEVPISLLTIIPLSIFSRFYTPPASRAKRLSVMKSIVRGAETCIHCLQSMMVMGGVSDGDGDDDDDWKLPRACACIGSRSHSLLLTVQR
jgi:hypothetical protein